jgi:hypothetical protein
MSDEHQPLDDATAEKVAVDTGIEAIRKIHAIERTMLNRAIHSLAEITGKPVEEVLAILSDGINSDYDQAVQQATASAKVAQLYVPNKKPTWEK